MWMASTTQRPAPKSFSGWIVTDNDIFLISTKEDFAEILNLDIISPGYIDPPEMKDESTYVILNKHRNAASLEEKPLIYFLSQNLFSLILRFASLKDKVVAVKVTKWIITINVSSCLFSPFLMCVNAHDVIKILLREMLKWRNFFQKPASRPTNSKKSISSRLIPRLMSSPDDILRAS